MKKSTKMKLFRGISLMLCIMMMMQLTQLFVFAVGEDPPAAETNGEATPIENTPSENLFELGVGELPYAQLQELSPLDVALPETISRAQAVEKGHVNRLYAQEKTLQSVLYQNQNGTKTAYVFDKPVKYVRDGEVLDKDTTIRATGIAGYAYAMTENSFSSYFGSTAANGVMIQYEDYAFSMKPETSMLVSTPTLGEDAKTVIYNGAFGAQTALRYETQLSGVKEDIILMRNVGKYAFNFLLTTSGLTPVKKENGAWTLVNAEQETVIDFGSIVIKDSAGKTVYGTLNITPRAAGGYIMTVTVPQAFLQASDTVYPVYVDPTTVVYEGTYEYATYEGSEVVYKQYDSVIDIGLYNDTSMYNSAIANTSQHYLSDGKGKIIYKLYDFYGENGQFTSLDAYQIGRVTFYMTSVEQLRCDISANPMTEYADDDQIAVKRTRLFSGFSTENATTQSFVCTYDDVIGVDITEIVKGWRKYAIGDSIEDYDDPENGFVISQSNSLIGDGGIYSTEATGNSNVYYEIETSVMGGKSFLRNKYMVDNDSALDSDDPYKGFFYLSREYAVSNDTRFDDSQNELTCWIISYRGSGKYGISPLVNPDYFINELGQLQLHTTQDFPNRFCWTIKSAANGYFIFKNYQNGVVLTSVWDNNKWMLTISSELATIHENYSKTLWDIDYHSGSTVLMESYSITNLSGLHFLHPNSTWTPNISVSQDEDPTWDTPSAFHWNIEDTDIATVDNATGTITAKNNGYTNITIIQKGAAVNSDGDRKIKIQLMVGQIIPNGVYHIQNIESQKYMDLESASTADGAPIQQWAYHTGSQALWNIQHEGGGVYTITSQRSNKYISVSNNSLNSDAAIVQTSQIHNAMLWKIEITESGNYKFVSVHSNMVIALPSSSTTNGLDLVQVSYTNDNVYTDEWLFEKVYDASIISIPEKYDRSSFYESVIDDLQSMGYTNIYAKEECMNDNILLNHIMKSKITVIRTHGSWEVLATSHDYLRYNEILALPAGSLNNVELIILGACSTGEGGANANNLVNAFADKGAQIVIGFRVSVYGSEMNDWCKLFFEQLKNGESVENAIEVVEQTMQEPYEEKGSNYIVSTVNPHIRGDQTTTFN